jgi:hypothetical protein
MSIKMYTESEVAESWHLTLEQFRLLRRRHGWSHVKFSRQDIRYTDAQLEQIVRDMTVAGSERPARVSGSGLTERARRRAHG